MNAAPERESVHIPFELGHLVGELAYGKATPDVACLLANPHPYMGGTMSNALIEALALGLAGDRCVTLRFDYRGVGESDGPEINVVDSMLQFWETNTTSQDTRMIDDVTAAADWLARQFGVPIVTVGYSFGTHTSVAADIPCHVGRVLISPTIQQHDFANIATHPLPTLVIFGGDDFAARPSQFATWIETHIPDAETYFVQSGEHFFRGQEQLVVRACETFLNQMQEAGVAQ